MAAEAAADADDFEPPGTMEYTSLMAETRRGSAASNFDAAPGLILKNAGVHHHVKRRRRRTGCIIAALAAAAVLILAARADLLGGPRDARPAALSTNPHVVLFLIDDQGFNDVGPDSTDLWWATPRLGELADAGVRLSRYYTMHLCTPARAALLTGRHPARAGMQHSMLSANEPWGLPLSETLWPELAESRGYEAAMYGAFRRGCPATRAGLLISPPRRAPRVYT